VVIPVLSISTFTIRVGGGTRSECRQNIVKGRSVATHERSSWNQSGHHFGQQRRARSLHSDLTKFKGMVNYGLNMTQK
jgi:hypothetical protein